MEKRRDGIGQIKDVLEAYPRGLKITGIAEKVSMNRNSVAKYLDMLLMAGQVEMKAFGRSKIYRLSGRVPLTVALSLSSELIVFIDDNFSVMDMNDQFLSFTGLSHDQVLGKTLDETGVDILVHPEILLNLKDALRGVECSREIRVRRAKVEYHFNAKLIPVTSGDGRRQIAIVFENITARKRAEIALRESEARYRAVVEDQTDLICRMLPDTTITFVNGAWRRGFQAVAGSVIGKKLIDLLPACSRADCLKGFNSICAGRPEVSFEHNLPVPDGHTRWFHSTFRGIFDSSGKLTDMQIVSRDVTECKQAEIALRESEENFRITFDRSPIGAAIVGPDLRFTRVNAELCRITGYSEQELLAVSFPEITHSDDREMSIRRYLGALEGQYDHYQLDKRYIRRDGQPIWTRVTVRLIKSVAGKPLYFLPMIEDITEKKKIEESLRLAQFSMDNATDTITWIDESGRLIYVNNAMCRNLGYSREELMAMTVWDVDPAFTKEVWAQHWEKVQKERHVKIESFHRARDGHDIPMEITVNYLCLGEIEYHCAYARDISRQAERADHPGNRL